MKSKYLGILLVIVVALFTGYTTYSSHQTNTKLADLSLVNIESLAVGENDDTMDGGETGNSNRTGYLDNPQSCTVKRTYKCTVGFTVPNWIPYIGGTQCNMSYIDEVDFPGTRNDCIPTGNPAHVCDYYRCTAN